MHTHTQSHFLRMNVCVCLCNRVCVAACESRQLGIHFQAYASYELSLHLNIQRNIEKINARITIFETILWCIFRVVLWFSNHELVVKHNTACNIVCLLAYQVNRMYIVQCTQGSICRSVCILPVCDTPDYFNTVTISLCTNLKHSRIRYTL